MKMANIALIIAGGVGCKNGTRYSKTVYQC